MTEVKIGAQLYSVRDRCSCFDGMLAALTEIKRMGYQTCQISGQGAEVTVPMQREILDRTGLICACTHIPFERMEEDFERVVADHRMLGCSYPGVGSMPAKYRKGAEGFRAFAKKAGEIAERMADRGLHFIYHNHAFEFQRFPDEGKNGLEILLESTPASFQFELDVFWVQAGGADPIDWIRRVAGRMDVIHLKEMNGSEQPPLMAPIGGGNMNWRSILAACDEARVIHAMVEQDNAVDTDSLQCMRESQRYLASIGARF